LLGLIVNLQNVAHGFGNKHGNGETMVSRYSDAAVNSFTACLTPVSQVQLNFIDQSAGKSSSIKFKKLCGTL
jgi:hypothetical protein